MKKITSDSKLQDTDNEEVSLYQPSNTINTFETKHPSLNNTKSTCTVTKKIVLDSLKKLLIHILVGVAVVMYWRGCWLLLDYSAGDLSNAYNFIKTALISLSIAAIAPLCACIMLLFIPSDIQQNAYATVRNVFTNKKKNGPNVNVLSTIIKKLLQYLLISLFGFTNVAFWRGIWYLCDYFILPDELVISCIITMSAGLLILFIMQRCSSMLSPPILLLSDRDSKFYTEHLYSIFDARQCCTAKN